MDSDDQKTALQAGFRAMPSERSIRLVFCHHAADLYPDDALHLAEYHDADRAELVFSFAGPSGGDWRDVWLIGGDDDQWRRYLELANEAASALDTGAAECGVSAETLAIQRPSTHRAGNPAFDEWRHAGAAKWTFAVLDLAIAGMLPIDCQKYPIDPIARRADALRAVRAMQPGSDDPEPEIQQAQRRGYVAELPDVVRASIYCLERLTAAPSDDEPSGHHCADRTPGTKSVASIKLNRWGIGHNGRDWILFNLDRNGGKPRWETRGKIDIPSGRCERIARHLLQQAQRDNGRAAVDQREVVELFRADYAGRTDEKIRASVVTPAMNKLRQAIRGSLERVCKATVTADPIPWDKTARIWDSPLTFGIVEKDDDGNVTLCVGSEV